MDKVYMVLYKLTYKDIKRNKEVKELFPELALCKDRKNFLRSQPKGFVEGLHITDISDFYLIQYGELGTETVPDKWMYGEVVSTKQVGKWYENNLDWRETEQEAIDIIKEKREISNKKYGHFTVEHYVNGERISIVKFN